MPPQVDQSGASSQGDIVGRDKIQQFYIGTSESKIIEQLLRKLDEEIAKDQQIQHTCDELQRFHTSRSHDGIIGLEEKLKVAGRATEYPDAIEMKEMFAKVLERWSLYASAQKLFVFLLARAEQRFKNFILPKIADLDQVQVNGLVSELIVDPTVDECGVSVFEINHNTAMGMIYWLAEQCFVRWHE